MLFDKNSTPAKLLLSIAPPPKKSAVYPGSSPISGTRVSYDENLRDYLNIYADDNAAGPTPPTNFGATSLWQLESMCVGVKDSTAAGDLPASAILKDVESLQASPNAGSEAAVVPSDMHSASQDLSSASRAPVPPSRFTVPKAVAAEFNKLIVTEQAANFHSIFLTDVRELNELDFEDYEDDDDE